MDRWVVVYALATLPVLAFGWAKGLPHCAAQAGVNLLVAACCLLVAGWTRDARQAAPLVLRLFYAPIIYWLFYHQVATLWPILRRESLDGVLAAWDLRLFGCQPSLAWQAALPSRGLSELFCFVYLAYYFFAPVVGFTALFRSGYLAAERLLLSVTGCFLLCYAFFWLVPTVGPHFWFPPATGPRLYDGYLFNHALFFFTRGGEIPGGAFPSSHIAVALLFTLLARREVKPLWLPMAGVTTLMLPAVVYLRAHFLVDVPAGLLAGLVAYGVSIKYIYK
jgi:hypothetical protein